jgi:hypothetical protein
MTAFECIGVTIYARGARSWAEVRTEVRRQKRKLTASFEHINRAPGAEWENHVEEPFVVCRIEEVIRTQAFQSD